MIFFPYKRDDLEDIRKEIEKDEEHFHAGPLKTKSELSVKVHVTSSSLNAHSFDCLFFRGITEVMGLNPVQA